MTPEQLRTALATELPPSAASWLAVATRRVHDDPTAIRVVFPTVGRHCGRARLHVEPLAGWTCDDAVRAVLLVDLTLTGDALAGEIGDLYRYGDAAERRAVLRALPLLDVDDRLVWVVEDALRTNDTRLVAAALGPYASRWLDQAVWRHGVLKCLFVGVPLDAVADLATRADVELARMCVDYARERTAAGRPVPHDLRRVLSAFPEYLHQTHALEV